MPGIRRGQMGDYYRPELSSRAPVDPPLVRNIVRFQPTLRLGIHTQRRLIA